MSEYFQVLPQLLLAVLLYMQAGALVIAVLHLPVQSLIERASLSFGLGVGAITYVMLLVNLVGVSLRLEYVLAPWLIGWTVYALRRHRPTASRIVLGDVRLSPLETALAAALLMVVIALCLRGTWSPQTKWDAWAIWDLKARSFFHERSFTPFIMGGYGYSHLDYPLLYPMAGTFVYLVMGRVADGVNLLPAIFYAGLIVQAYYGFRRAGGSGPTALAAATGLAMTPSILDPARQFLSEVPFLYYVLGGSLSMVHSLRRNFEVRTLLLATLLFACATQTRPEGILLVAPTMAVLCVHALRLRTTQAWEAIAIFTAVILATASPWILFLVFGVTGASFGAKGADLLSATARIPGILLSYVTWTMTPSYLNLYFLIFPLTYMAIALRVRAFLRDRSLAYFITHTICLPLPALLLMAVQPQWASMSGYARYLVPFTAHCFVLFCLLALECCENEVDANATTSHGSSLYRIAMTIAAAILATVLSLDVVARLLHISMWNAATSESLAFVPRTLTELPAAMSATSAMRRMAVDNERRPFFGDLIAAAIATTPVDSTVAMWIGSKEPNPFLHWKACYDLLPRRVIVVRREADLSAAFLLARNVCALIVYDDDSLHSLGEVVLESSPRHRVIRISDR
jgi:hypothetical protein